MTRITVYKDKNNHYTGFRCDGHSDYADSGEDIVCSAISVLTITLCNAIEELTDDAFSGGADAESGLISMDFPEGLGHDAALLMDAFILGVQSIEEEYSEFIHFEIEEV